MFLCIKNNLNKMKIRYLSLMIFFSLILLNSCKEDKKKKQIDQPIVPITQLSYELIGTLPHNTNSFTEGLLWNDGKLFESTGSPEDLKQTKSVVGIVDTTSGNIDVKVEIDRNIFFGEGIVILNDKLYQLTYKNQTCFIYDAKSFKQIGTYKYTNSEGWGMTTDGKSLILSDGTDKITYWNPSDMSTEKVIEVKAKGVPQAYLNELEYVNGYIYANLWTTNQIVKIDPNTGNIVAFIDFAELATKAKSVNPNIAEMNGLAYHKTDGLLYVTGKFWANIYKVKINL
jgi:glutaminyl-peptide cyclotransferase